MVIRESLSLEQQILFILYQSKEPMKEGKIYEKLANQSIESKVFEDKISKLYDLGIIDYDWDRYGGRTVKYIKLSNAGESIAKGIERYLMERHPKLEDPEILKIHGPYSYEDKQTHIGSMQIEGTWGFKNIFFGSEFWSETEQHVVYIAIPQYCTEVDNVVKEIEVIMTGILPIEDKKRIVVFHEEFYDAPFITYDVKTNQYGFWSETYSSRKAEEASLHDLMEIVEYISKYYSLGIDRTSREPFVFTARISYESFKGMNIFELQNEKGENVLEELSSRFGDEEIEITVRRK